MFWQRNRNGLITVTLALSLIGGEVGGFASPTCATLWPWAACLFVFAVCVSIGWSVPFGKHLVLLILGVTLAWRLEATRLDIEARSHRLGADGFPPTFDIKVESEVARRWCARKGRWTVSFDSHIGDLPVKVVAPIRHEKAMPSSGETWRCSGWLSLKKSAPSRYSRRTLWVVDENHLTCIADANRWMTAKAIYNRASDMLSQYAGVGLGWCPELASFNRAMLFGRRTEVSPNKRKVFATAGTLHVFAISGLHVMLVLGLLNALLSKVGLPPLVCAACIITLVSVYVMISGAHPSAVRAALMASFWLGARFFGRKSDTLAAWGNTALAVYGISPSLIFDTGCALSFAVMLGIVLWIRWAGQFATPLDWMRRIAAHALSLGENHRAAMLLLLHRWGLLVLGALGISCAAWIAGAPIAARVFGRITLGSLVANIAVVPLAGGAVVLGAIGVVASMVSTPLGALINNLSALCTWLMERISEMVAGVPWISFETLPWSWRDCLFWYLAWFMLFSVLARHLPPREWISVKVWNGDHEEHGKAKEE